MSGGVDSTVTALLLHEQGYEVYGFFMRLPFAENERQVERVRALAVTIDVPLQVLDVREQFADNVIGYFVRQYREGRTPNPCVVCNKTIKFGLLFDAMIAAGMDLGATGHYARISRRNKNGYCLLRGTDPKKDQSYFLCRLEQEQLARTLFPLGTWNKKDVYAKAASSGLRGFSGGESQDVCFLSTGLQQFLSDRGVVPKSGEIRSLDGKTLGFHNGISHYTVGQRRGLGVPDATPWYVVGLDPDNNRILVGKKDDLFNRYVPIRDLHWSGGEGSLPWQGLVQLRSRHRPASAVLEQTADNEWLLTCDEPQRGITPGQFAVLYDRDRVVGSGVIQAGEAAYP